jgi:hypothetical protein
MASIRGLANRCPNWKHQSQFALDSLSQKVSAGHFKNLGLIYSRRNK